MRGGCATTREKATRPLIWYSICKGLHFPLVYAIWLRMRFEGVKETDHEVDVVVEESATCSTPPRKLNAERRKGDFQFG